MNLLAANFRDVVLSIDTKSGTRLNLGRNSYPWPQDVDNRLFYAKIPCLNSGKNSYVSFPRQRCIFSTMMSWCRKKTSCFVGWTLTSTLWGAISRERYTKGELPCTWVKFEIAKFYCLKGTVSWDRFQKFWQKFTALGLTKGRGWFL